MNRRARLPFALAHDSTADCLLLILPFVSVASHCRDALAGRLNDLLDDLTHRFGKGWNRVMERLGNSDHLHPRAAA
jgi:hypothetical protein